MIRRLLWLMLGVVLGAWAAFRLKRLLRAMMPQSVAHQAAGLGRSVRAFAGDVKVAMNDREHELRDALGLADPPAPPKHELAPPDAEHDTDKDRH